MRNWIPKITSLAFVLAAPGLLSAQLAPRPGAQTRSAPVEQAPVRDALDDLQKASFISAFESQPAAPATQSSVRQAAFQSAAPASPLPQQQPPSIMAPIRAPVDSAAVRLPHTAVHRPRVTIPANPGPPGPGSHIVNQRFASPPNPVQSNAGPQNAIPRQRIPDRRPQAHNARPQPAAPARTRKIVNRFVQQAPAFPGALPELPQKRPEYQSGSGQHFDAGYEIMPQGDFARSNRNASADQPRVNNTAITTLADDIETVRNRPLIDSGHFRYLSLDRVFAAVKESANGNPAIYYQAASEYWMLFEIRCRLQVELQQLRVARRMIRNISVSSGSQAPQPLRQLAQQSDARVQQLILYLAAMQNQIVQTTGLVDFASFELVTSEKPVIGNLPPSVLQQMNAAIEARPELQQSRPAVEHAFVDFEDNSARMVAFHEEFTPAYSTVRHALATIATNQSGTERQLFTSVTSLPALEELAEIKSQCIDCIAAQQQSLVNMRYATATLLGAWKGTDNLDVIDVANETASRRTGDVLRQPEPQSRVEPQPADLPTDESNSPAIEPVPNPSIEPNGPANPTGSTNAENILVDTSTATDFASLVPAEPSQGDANSYQLDPPAESSHPPIVFLPEMTEPAGQAVREPALPATGAEPFFQRAPVVQPEQPQTPFQRYDPTRDPDIAEASDW